MKRIFRYFRRHWAISLAAFFVFGPVLWILAYSLIQPPITTIMAERAWERWKAGRAPALQHRTTSIDNIAPSLAIAVISAEDQRFLEHNGFDFDAISKAMDHNRRSRRKRGASTISQQVAKNAFLWEDRSWLRKGLEIPFTMGIEILWSKRRILEVYLSAAEMGPGVFGAEAAAQYWFHKPASRLSPSESARLAAMLPAPSKCNPRNPSGVYARRVRWVLAQMAHQDQGNILEKLEVSSERKAIGRRHSPARSTPPAAEAPQPTDTGDEPSLE